MKDNVLLIGAWFNALIGTLTWAEPFLSSLAYTFSIVSSIVYIWVNLKKRNNEKIN